MPLATLRMMLAWIALTACQEAQFNGGSSVQSAAQIAKDGTDSVPAQAESSVVSKISYSSCDEAKVENIQIVIAIDASVSQLTRDPDCARRTKVEAMVQKIADTFSTSAINVNLKAMGFAEDAFSLSTQWRNVKIEASRAMLQEDLQGVCDRPMSGTRLVPVMRMAEESFRGGMNGVSQADVRSYLLVISDGQPNNGETKEARRDSAKTLWQLPKTSVMTVAYAATNLGGDVPALKVLAEPADQNWSQLSGKYFRAEGADQLSQVLSEMVQKISICN